MSMATKLNTNYIKKQCEKIKSKYQTNVDSVSEICFDTLSKEIDPVIWNFMVIITMSDKELEKLNKEY